MAKGEQTRPPINFGGYVDIKFSKYIQEGTWLRAKQDIIVETAPIPLSGSPKLFLAKGEVATIKRVRLYKFVQDGDMHYYAQFDIISPRYPNGGIMYSTKPSCNVTHDIETEYEILDELPLQLII